MQESDRVEPTAGTSHAVVPVPGSAARNVSVAASPEWTPQPWRAISLEIVR